MKNRLIRYALLSFALSSAGAAMAASAEAPAAPQGQQTEQAMFAFADGNHDGRLTRDEARLHLPMTYGNFDRIDTAKRGWISYDQFVQFTNERVQHQAEAVLKIGDWH